MISVCGMAGVLCAAPSANPVIFAHVPFNIAPTEGHGPPDLVVGQDAARHPVVDCSDSFPQPRRDLGFVQVFLRRVRRCRFLGDCLR